MSAGDTWANDSESTKGRGCFPRLALLASVAAVVLVLSGCDELSPVEPSAPATGVQPQPPVTAVVPSAVVVRP
ncbi:hypothetical protein SAMN04488074_105132 [Lentzea albidocapillata subsp. violacea]|uniref:Uncharacterized protein n=1 Tax=Lentzea albidocapillata subsp. violacea TaxID=128104 RepID=A0A1G9AVA4_9PSEU|nr:hypothetical protein [Lentzea albidocapillata]SDK31329.1 hypothetical protein SAMN04488074_105132 [Lentzea albidocapillata subsp. violacea]